MTGVFLSVPRIDWCSLVTAIFLYARESWTLTAAPQRRIQAMEMRSYRKILRISYKDHVTNEEVRAKIQQAFGPHEHVLTIVKRRKPQWYGHVSRSSGSAKTILQGTVKGGRSQSRQRKRWGNNIREWTGLEFAKFERAVGNGEKWRKLVMKSSVVPQRPSRLRDKWWWWWWWWWWCTLYFECMYVFMHEGINLFRFFQYIILLCRCMSFLRPIPV